MNSPTPTGRVASLHLHPVEPGDPMSSAQTIDLVEHKGISGEPRYFGKLSRRTGQPSRRQVSLMAREEISEHAAELGLQTIPPGAVRANIETLGLNLVDLLGREIQIGDAVLRVYEARIPCSRMDAICDGLRERMSSNRQGVLAEIVRSGVVRVGDTISARA